MAQFDPSMISRVENGKILFLMDVRWTEAQKKEVEKLFNLDSTVWEKIVLKTPEIVLDSVSWNVKPVSKFVIELSKDLENRPAIHFNINDVFLSDEIWTTVPGYIDQDKVIYGANSFKNTMSFEYKDGLAQFYLPGYLKNNRAYIAGSFNSWNPAETAMHKVDSGWVVKIPLPVGKHLYKFIIDGKWMPDPNNRLTENDGEGNFNSTIFCPNYEFHLYGYPKAKTAMITGSFNSWNKKELRMQQDEYGWVIKMYLRDGTYTYKFYIDGEWITDPSAKEIMEDGNGGMNSVIGIGDEYSFRLKAYPDAKRVYLAGSFNGWNPNELLMRKTDNGWILPYKLASGNYEYKFIIDGNWINDPVNPYTIGSGNMLNSYLAFKANHTFILTKFPDAHEVRVTGTFLNWSNDGYRMIKKDGKWTCPVYLSPGKSLYKYIVDGEWILDPDNKVWEQNEYGNGNSVIWIRKSQ